MCKAAGKGLLDNAYFFSYLYHFMCNICLSFNTEKEEYVDSLIIAPAERYTIEAYFENSGEYEMKNINPWKTYSIGKINV